MHLLEDSQYAQYLDGGHGYLGAEPIRIWLGALTPSAVARCAIPPPGANDGRGPLARTLFDGVLNGRGSEHLHGAGELRRALVEHVCVGDGFEVDHSFARALLEAARPAGGVRGLAYACRLSTEHGITLSCVEVSVACEGTRPGGSVFDAAAPVRVGLCAGALQRQFEIQVIG